MKQNLQTPATPLEMLSLFLPAGLLDYFDPVNHVGSVVILGGLTFVISLYAYTFTNLYRKNLLSTTPRNEALNALIFALKASAAAFVLLFTK